MKIICLTTRDLTDTLKHSYERWSKQVYREKSAEALVATGTSCVEEKERMRSLTSRSNGWGNEKRKVELKQFIIGWVNYYKLADIKTLLRQIDEWYRKRLRSTLWKQWKHIRTRMRNLVKLALPKSKAWQYANTRKAYWHTANSPIVTRTITTEHLRLSGYTFFTDYYRKVMV